MNKSCFELEKHMSDIYTTIFAPLAVEISSETHAKKKYEHNYLRNYNFFPEEAVFEKLFVLTIFQKQ